MNIFLLHDFNAAAWSSWPTAFNLFSRLPPNHFHPQDNDEIAVSLLASTIRMTFNSAPCNGVREGVSCRDFKKVRYKQKI